MVNGPSKKIRKGDDQVTMIYLCVLVAVVFQVGVHAASVEIYAPQFCTARQVAVEWYRSRFEPPVSSLAVSALETGVEILPETVFELNSDRYLLLCVQFP